MNRTRSYRIKDGISLDDTAWIGATGNDLESAPTDEGDLVVRSSGGNADIFLKRGNTYIRVLGAKHNLVATTNPSAVDDSSVGWASGSIWINTSSTTIYMCAVASVGAAVWRDISSNTGGGGGTASIRERYTDPAQNGGDFWMYREVATGLRTGNDGGYQNSCDPIANGGTLRSVMKAHVFIWRAMRSNTNASSIAKIDVCSMTLAGWAVIGSIFIPMNIVNQGSYEQVALQATIDLSGAPINIAPNTLYGLRFDSRANAGEVTGVERCQIVLEIQ